MWKFGKYENQRTNALTMSRFCRCSYMPHGQRVKALSDNTELDLIESITQGNASAWHAVGISGVKPVGVLAVTGSNDSLDWFQDLDATQTDFNGGLVHRGFLDHCGQLWPSVTRLVHTGIGYHLTGHSLGGAVAQILARQLKDRLGLKILSVSCFGSPRVFDPVASSRLTDLPIKRYVNTGDVVPYTPTRSMGYAHTGLDLYLSRDGRMRTERRHWLVRLFEDQVARFGQRFFSQTSWAIKNHSIKEYERRLSLGGAS